MSITAIIMEDSMETKVCNACGLKKPVTEFHKGSNGAAYAPRCKPCRSIQQASAYRDNWFRKYYIGKRSWCKTKGILFELTPDYLKEIYTGVCPVYDKEFVRHDKTHPHSPALDRVNPNKGYVQGNVQWVSARANRIKYDASIEELEMILKYMKDNDKDDPCDDWSKSPIPKPKEKDKENQDD